MICCVAGVDKEVWDALKDDNIWAERGTKLSLNRFQSVVHHAISEGPLWTKRYLGLIYSSIQLGVINQSLVKKLEAAKLTAQAEAEESGVKATTSRDELGALRLLTSRMLVMHCLVHRIVV